MTMPRRGHARGAPPLYVYTQPDVSVVNYAG